MVKEEINPAIEIFRSRMFEMKNRVDLYGDGDECRKINGKKELIKLYKLSAILYSKLVGGRRWKDMYETIIRDYES